MTSPVDANVTSIMALSVDAPLGQAIAGGHRTAIVLDWRPATLPTGDLLIVEAPRGTIERDENAHGLALAVVRLAHIEDWSSPERGTCSTWPPGWVAWQFTDIRPLAHPIQAPARSGLYTIPLTQPL